MTELWAKFKTMVEAEPQGPVLRPFRWIVLPLLILAVSTVIARIGDFDFAIQKAIYTAGGDSWDFGSRSLWWFLYEYGTMPAAIICGLAVFGFILGLFKDDYKRWRQVFLFVILLGAIGPGVVSNLILKEYWGRPRPREVEGIGGKYAFEPVLTIDKTSKGKSFPCGHATMGYFFIGGFFLFRRYRRSWAWFFLIFGLCLGFFMGVARMCKGGHFFSDVMWSGAIMYFTALILYYDLRLYKGLLLSATAKPTPKWMKIAVPVLGSAVLLGILLATPYRDLRDYHLTSKEGPLDVNLILKRGTIVIVPADKFRVKGEAWGHGVPTSQIAVHFLELDRPDSTSVFYKERMSGKFTEVDQSLTISLPWDRMRSLTLDVSDSDAQIVLPDDFDSAKKISITDGSGNIEFKTVPATFTWMDSDDKEKYGQPADSVKKGSPVIDVLDGFSGELNLKR